MDKHKVYYYLNRLMSNTWAWFYIAIGSRGRGKTTSAWRWVLKRYLENGEKFVWLRLTESPLKKMSGARGITLVPQCVMDELKLDSVRIQGTVIYLKRRCNNKYEECGLMDALSTFYTTKGSDLTKYTNVVLDEFNREAGEKRGFDVVRSFINEIETIARTRTNVRVLMLANVISEVSEILTIFNFQPRTFGLYKLKRKHCVIEYLEDSPEWIEYSKNTLARSLLENAGDTNTSFENKAQVDYSNIKKFNNRYTPVFILYTSTTVCYQIYAIGNDIRGDGLLVDSVIRNEKTPTFKLTPFITANAVFDKDLIAELKDIMGDNKLYYPTTIVRYKFLLDFQAKNK